jgi:hypothetical protein
MRTSNLFELLDRHSFKSMQKHIPLDVDHRRPFGNHTNTSISYKLLDEHSFKSMQKDVHGSWDRSWSIEGTGKGLFNRLMAGTNKPSGAGGG